MARSLFAPPPIAGGGGYSYRVDTAAGSDSPALLSPTGALGQAIEGSVLRASDEGELPRFVGPEGVTTLYAKRLTSRGAVTGSPVTLTGVAMGVAAGGSVPAVLASPLTLESSYAGGDDDGAPGHYDSTSRLNLQAYQRGNFGSFGETIRHYLMRKDAKAMETWLFPDGGYDDVTREPRGTFRPVVWAGAHWEANNHASNHKHWSVETPDPSGQIQTRFEVRFGDPTRNDAIAGLDKTLIQTNLADFVVRCSNGQQLRLSSPAGGDEKSIEFNHDSEGSTANRRWKLRATGEPETGTNAGTNFHLARYGDDGVAIDNPVVVSRSSGNVTLTPAFVVRRTSATVSSLSLNTASLGGGAGVFAIGNVTTAPATNPTGGGVLYVVAGALTWRGSNGTVTTIGPA